MCMEITKLFNNCFYFNANGDCKLLSNSVTSDIWYKMWLIIVWKYSAHRVPYILCKFTSVCVLVQFAFEVLVHRAARLNLHLRPLRRAHRALLQSIRRVRPRHLPILAPVRVRPVHRIYFLRSHRAPKLFLQSRRARARLRWQGAHFRTTNMAQARALWTRAIGTLLRRCIIRMRLRVVPLLSFRVPARSWLQVHS